ncbi:MAG: ABC transporter substrate-binding protein [Nitrososphaera sp.]
MWLFALDHTSGATTTRIGAILPLTGPGASFGQSSKNALMMATDEINKNLENARLELLVEDGMTDPKASVSAFSRLYYAEDTRIFITSISSVSLALAPLVEGKQSLLFANASHPQVTTGRKFVFRYSNTAQDESRVLHDFVSNRTKWSRLYIVSG